MSKQYLCPKCDHIFVVGTVKGLFGKRSMNGAVVKCPKCGAEGNFKEID